MSEKWHSYKIKDPDLREGDVSRIFWKLTLPNLRAFFFATTSSTCTAIKFAHLKLMVVYADFVYSDLIVNVLF
jgi:hypothetical protein